MLDKIPICLSSLRICLFLSMRARFYLIFLRDFYKIVLKKISKDVLFLLLLQGGISYIYVSPDGYLSNWS